MHKPQESRKKSRGKCDPWGIPPWTIDFRPSSHPLPEHTDFAVVGGGFTGLSAAAWLRRIAPGKSVAVFESGCIGSGASGRTGGMALAESAAGDLPGLGDVLGGFEEILREWKIECELNLPGAFEIARSNGLPDSPIDWTDDGNLRAVGEVPGGSVNPGMLVSGLARAAESAGAAIHEHASVESLRRNAKGKGPVEIEISIRGGESGARKREKVRQDVPSRFHVRAGRALIAANAQSLELSGLARSAEPKLTLAVATAPLSAEQIVAIGLASGKSFYTVDFPYLWGRVTASRGVVFGAGLVAVNGWRELAGIDVSRGRAAEMIARIEQRIGGLHPALRRVEFTHRWGGPILFTEDMKPVFRWLAGKEPEGSDPAREGPILVLGGYSGHGVAQSVYLGRWAAQALLGERTPPDWPASAEEPET